jgi:hypothetical protein
VKVRKLKKPREEKETCQRPDKFKNLRNKPEKLAGKPALVWKSSKFGSIY